MSPEADVVYGFYRAFRSSFFRKYPLRRRVRPAARPGPLSLCGRVDEADGFDIEVTADMMSVWR
jgi:hypothetical protein